MHDRKELNGVVLECLRCGKPCLLPYVDDKREAVDITSITGWTALPLRCPECSQSPTQGIVGNLRNTVGIEGNLKTEGPIERKGTEN